MFFLYLLGGIVVGVGLTVIVLGLALRAAVGRGLNW